MRFFLILSQKKIIFCIIIQSNPAILKSQGKWIKVQNSGALKKPGKRKGEGQIQGQLILLRNSRDFELTGFEIARFDCIVQQHFWWKYSFQRVSNQAEKLQKFEMVGGMTSTSMEIPGGGDLKQNCPPWWGRVNIFWNCTFNKYHWYILKSYTHVVLPLPVGPSIAFSPGCMIPLQHKNQTNWVLLVVVSQEGEDLIKVVLCSSDLLQGCQKVLK